MTNDAGDLDVAVSVAVVWTHAGASQQSGPRPYMGFSVYRSTLQGNADNNHSILSVHYKNISLKLKHYGRKRIIVIAK